MKDKKFFYGSIIAVAFLLTFGLTYAYFILTISGNDAAQYVSGNESASNPFVIE